MKPSGPRAVLAKNFPKLLDEAVERVEKEGADALVAFRANTRWVGPRNLITAQHGAAPIYFRSGEEQSIRYEGTLVRVVVRDEQKEEAKKLLDDHQLESTRNETWDGLKSVYLVQGLRRVAETPIEAFLKPDGTPAKAGMFPFTLVEATAPLPGFLYPGEASSERSFREGPAAQVMVSRYERDPAARAECINKYGDRCVVCSLSFGEMYGDDIGAGFIHVHHLDPLSSSKGAEVATSVERLRPVCANCHAMLHRTNPPLSPEDLKRRLKSRG